MQNIQPINIYYVITLQLNLERSFELCISPTFAIISNRPTTGCTSIEDRIVVSLWNCNRERKYRDSFVHESSLRSFDSPKRPGKKFSSPLIRGRSSETSISEIENFRFVVVHYDFPTNENRRWKRNWVGDMGARGGRRKREANGFPVAVNRTSINIPCFSLCSLRFFPNSPPIKFLFTYISLLPGGNKIPTKGLLARICCVHVANVLFSPRLHQDILVKLTFFVQVRQRSWSCRLLFHSLHWIVFRLLQMKLWNLEYIYLCLL